MSMMPALRKNRPFNVEMYYMNAETADVVFKCGTTVEGKEDVPAHKILLAGYANSFNTMFSTNFRESMEIEVDDATAHGFREFLRYFYFSELSKLNIDVIGEVMYLARKYLVHTFFDECCQILSQQDEPKAILIGYAQSIRFALSELKLKMERLILIHSEAIFSSNHIVTIERSLLRKVICIPSVRIQASKFIFNGCMLWAQEACKQADDDPMIGQNLRNRLGGCFRFIDFSAMTNNEIVECVKQFGEVFTSKELKNIIFMISAKSLAPITGHETEIEVSKETERGVAVARGTKEKFVFITETRMLLKSFTVSRCFGMYTAEEGFMARVSKMYESKREHTIHTEIFRFDSNCKFQEDIILDEHATYIIEIVFLTNVNYVRREIIHSTPCPINVQLETDSNFIASVKLQFN